MAKSQELILKEKREQAARNALEADKLIKGPLAEAEEWALANPDPALEKQERLAEGPGIHPGDISTRPPTPETRYEANKDFLKAVATEVAADAALGGVGKATAFLPTTNLQGFKKVLGDLAYNAPLVGGSAKYDRMVAKANAAVPQEVKDKIRATMTREQGAPVYGGVPGVDKFAGEPIEGTFWEIFPDEGNQQAQALYERAVRLGHVKDGKAYYGEF